MLHGMGSWQQKYTEPYDFGTASITQTNEIVAVAYTSTKTVNICPLGHTGVKWLTRNRAESTGQVPSRHARVFFMLNGMISIINVTSTKRGKPWYHTSKQHCSSGVHTYQHYSQVPFDKPAAGFVIHFHGR